VTWIDTEERKPTKSGLYPVVIVGEEERDGPHVYYSYDAYTTFMDIKVDEDGGISGTGLHDEGWWQVVYWLDQPIVLPPIPEGA
jgi:hypothetical protein